MDSNTLLLKIGANGSNRLLRVGRPDPAKENMPNLMAHSGGRAVAATTGTIVLFLFCFWKYTSLSGHGSGTTALLATAAAVLPHGATEAATVRRRGPQTGLPCSAYRAYGPVQLKN